VEFMCGVMQVTSRGLRAWRLDIVPAQLGHRHTPPEVCMSVVRGRHCASARQTTPDRRRHAN
jgi:hypothetical protein